MTIAMLEVMNLRERQEDLYTNYYDSSRKPQGIDLYLFIYLPLHSNKYMLYIVLLIAARRHQCIARKCFYRLDNL